MQALAAGKTYTGSDLAAYAIRQSGISFCFGIPGVQNLALYSGIEKYGVENVLISNEEVGLCFPCERQRRVLSRCRLDPTKLYLTHPTPSLPSSYLHK